jgi:hypothetical protein
VAEFGRVACSGVFGGAAGLLSAGDLLRWAAIHTVDLTGNTN